MEGEKTAEKTTNPDHPEKKDRKKHDDKKIRH